MTASPVIESWPARRLIVAGGGTIAALCLGITLWGLLAEVADVTALPGIVASTDPPVGVQHLTGGAIVAVHVTAGTKVAAGDPLVQLDDASLRVEAARLAATLTERRGEAALAEAELHGTNIITLPNTMPVAVAERYLGLFAERRARAAETRAQLAAQRDRFMRRQASVAAQTTAITRQRSILATELSAQTLLRDRGLIQTSRVTGLEAEVARLDAQLAALAGEAEAARDSAAETEIALAAEAATRREEAARRLQTLAAEIGDLTLRENEVARLIADRLLRAPVAGRMHATRIPRAGEVLRPAEVAMTILPEATAPVVRFRIPPDHLEKVTTGQILRLRLPTETRNGRVTPDISVTSIAVAPQEDSTTGAVFYLAEAALITPAGQAKALQTGQQVEVLLPAPPLRPLARLFAPLTVNFPPSADSG
jgi:HlyD family type I secretion membrane fusion protein